MVLEKDRDRETEIEKRVSVRERARLCLWVCFNVRVCHEREGFSICVCERECVFACVFACV